MAFLRKIAFFHISWGKKIKVQFVKTLCSLWHENILFELDSTKITEPSKTNKKKTTKERMQLSLEETE